MEPSEHLARFRDDAARFAASVRAGRDAPVASCPGWTVADLAVHLGVVHRWANETVATLATARVRGAVDRWGVPTDRPDLAEWYEECAATLASTLERADPDTPVWTFGEPGTVRFWVRRQANETLVHRWDAQTALGALDPVDPEHAADAADEFLTSLLANWSQPGTGSFHFHRTDGPGEWIVRFGGGGPAVERAHAKGDVAVRAPAVDLLLFLWRRVPADAVEVFGDEADLARWFEQVPAV